MVAIEDGTGMSKNIPLFYMDAITYPYDGTWWWNPTRTLSTLLALLMEGTAIW